MATAGGEAGLTKMTLPTAFTTAVLAWGLLTFPQGYSRSKSTAATVDEVRVGAQYLLSAIGGESAPFLVSQVGFTLRISQVCLSPGRQQHPLPLCLVQQSVAVRSCRMVVCGLTSANSDLWWRKSSHCAETEQSACQTACIHLEV